MDKHSKIYIAGHRGLVGSTLQKRLEGLGYTNLVVRARAELDLTDTAAVNAFFTQEMPEYVIDCAAKVGGLKDKLAHPAEFLTENIQIQNNLIWAAELIKVTKFIFISSATVYPNICEQPISEDALLSGKLDTTNEAYGLAKITGIKLCDFISEEYGLNFISCVPNNLYGENDNFDPETAQVLPALISRIHAAKINRSPDVTIWGTGEARREFLHVEDLADALIWVLEHDAENHMINIGSGTDISIKQLAELIQKIAGYEGRLVFDSSKPNGTPQRLLDSSRISDMGWKPAITLEEGIRRTYHWYSDSSANSF
jgi:GDP-L-fucose synthase